MCTITTKVQHVSKFTMLPQTLVAVLLHELLKKKKVLPEQQYTTLMILETVQLANSNFPAGEPIACTTNRPHLTGILMLCKQHLIKIVKDCIYSTLGMQPFWIIQELGQQSNPLWFHSKNVALAAHQSEQSFKFAPSPQILWTSSQMEY